MMSKKGRHFEDDDTMTEKVHHLLEEKRVTPSVTAPGDTNLSDATVDRATSRRGKEWEKGNEGQGKGKEGKGQKMPDPSPEINSGYGVGLACIRCCACCVAGSNWCYEQLGCAHHCESNALGTKCVCRKGYQLHSNGKDCVGTPISYLLTLTTRQRRRLTTASPS